MYAFTVTKNSESAIVRRFVLILLWHDVGRVAECVLTNWTLVEWFHTLNYTVLNWSQLKTGKQKGVAICPATDGSKSPMGVCISLGTGCFISKSIAQKIYIIMPGGASCQCNISFPDTCSCYSIQISKL